MFGAIYPGQAAPGVEPQYSSPGRPTVCLPTAVTIQAYVSAVTVTARTSHATVHSYTGSTAVTKYSSTVIPTPYKSSTTVKTCGIGG